MTTRQISRPGVNCPTCGILRLLPEGIRFGHRFSLGLCGACQKSTFTGRYFGLYIWRS